MTVTARERRRQLLRSDIVAATLQLIEDEGVDAASIEAIADGAGVARATIYAHFPSGRDEILRAAYDRAGDIVLEHAREGVTGVVGWDARILSYARTMIGLSSTTHEVLPP